MLCKQQGQNMNLFIGWRVFYGLDSIFASFEGRDVLEDASDGDSWVSRLRRAPQLRPPDLRNFRHRVAQARCQADRSVVGRVDTLSPISRPSVMKKDEHSV